MKLEARNTQLSKQRADVEQERGTIQADLASLTAKKEPSASGAFLSLSQRHTLSIQVEELETRLRANGKLLAEIDQEQVLVQRQIEKDRQDEFNQEERPRRSREIENAAREILQRLWDAVVDAGDDLAARIVTPERELQEDCYRICNTRQLPASRAVHLARETTKVVREIVERSMKDLP